MSKRAVVVVAAMLIGAGGAACADGGGEVSIASTSPASTAETSTTAEASSTSVDASSTTVEASTTEPVVDTTVEGPASDDETTPVLEAGSIGIIVNEDGTIVRFAFGEASINETVTALVTALGEPDDISLLAECGEGVLESISWPSGLATYYADGVLVGWAVRSNASGDFTTLDGIGRGSTLADLEDAFADVVVGETSLGVEWASTPSSGISGLLTGDGQDDQVTTLWSGSTCIAR
jgi:hypothetical protein